MARDSMLVEADTVDASSAAAPWLDLAQQLKRDLASIILMSDEDLQVALLHLTNCVFVSHHSVGRKQDNSTSD